MSYLYLFVWGQHNHLKGKSRYKIESSTLNLIYAKREKCQLTPEIIIFMSIPILIDHVSSFFEQKKTDLIGRERTSEFLFPHQHNFP